MAECPTFDYLLVIPRLRIQNANAISSPLTHGFPSMTAFLGLMWALERKTNVAGLDLRFNAVGVIAHHHEEQVNDGGFVNTFNLTRNPIDKDGSTAAIVEEGRIHLDISLVFAVQSEALSEEASAQRITAQVRDQICQMRVAGGTVIPAMVSPWRQRPYLVPQTGDAAARREKFDELKLKLLPGFALVERQDLLESRYQSLLRENADSTRLDAWLSLARINWRWHEAHSADVDDSTGAEESDAPPNAKSGWRHDREGLGWIVPIPLGYGALSELQPPGTVANVRDREVPFRFVESLYGIGQWLSPHRLIGAEQLLWYSDIRSESTAYRCCNDYRPAPVYDFN